MHWPCMILKRRGSTDVFAGYLMPVSMKTPVVMDLTPKENGKRKGKSRYETFTD